MFLSNSAYALLLLRFANSTNSLIIGRFHWQVKQIISYSAFQSIICPWIRTINKDTYQFGIIPIY